MRPPPRSRKQFRVAWPPRSAPPGPQGPSLLPREQFAPNRRPSAGGVLGFPKPLPPWFGEGVWTYMRFTVSQLGNSENPVSVLSVKAQWLPKSWDTQKIGEDKTSDFHMTVKCPGVAPLRRRGGLRLSEPAFARLPQSSSALPDAREPWHLLPAAAYILPCLQLLRPEQGPRYNEFELSTYSMRIY